MCMLVKFPAVNHPNTWQESNIDFPVQLDRCELARSRLLHLNEHEWGVRNVSNARHNREHKLSNESYFYEIKIKAYPAFLYASQGTSWLSELDVFKACLKLCKDLALQIGTGS